MEPMPSGGAGAAFVLGWVSAWILTYLVHSTLLLAAAWAAGRVVRAPAARELLWKAATVGALLTATASVALEGRTGPFPVAARTAAAAGAVRDSAARLPRLPAPGHAVAGLWLLAALFGVLRLERGRRGYWRRVGRRGTLADPATVDTLRRLQDAAVYPRTVHLTTSDGIGAPAAIGTAEICLPADSFAALSPVQRESVLAHELGHLSRRDPLWRFALDVLGALFPVQPLLRVARRELRECAEMLCDDFAVQLTGRRRPLVESLAILASSLRPEHAPAVAFGEGDSPLVRRAARVLDVRRAPPRPLQRAAAGGLAAILLVATAALAPAFPPPVPAPKGGVEIRLVTVEDDSVGASAGLRRGAGDAGRQGGRRRRELSVRRTADGELVREYLENGVPTEPDASDRRWIADVLDHREVP